MDDIFHECELRPVRLVLPERTGWSLWGGNAPDGRDYLLPVGRRYGLFDTPEALCRYVGGDRSSHVLARTPGWTRLVGAISSGTPEMSDPDDFRLDRLFAWRTGNGLGGLLDCLNLVWDLGAQFDDPLLIGFSRPGGPLRRMYDALWLDCDDVAEPDQVQRASRQAVLRVAELAVWNPAHVDHS
ncbi:hypothetical protein [Micromonospora sp. NPDC004704]